MSENEDPTVDEPVADEPIEPTADDATRGVVGPVVLDPPDDEVDRSGPLAWMARNTVASNVLMWVLIAGGLAVLALGIKQEVFPEVELDMVLVNVAYPGASPAEVEQGVILALEEAVRGLDGVKEIRSTASEGVAVVAIDLLLGADTDRALNDVKSAVDRVTSFPEDIERPVISLATNRKQVISIVVFGDRSEEELRALGESMREGLLDDEKITYVDLAGTRPLEISVEVPQERLREHGLTLQGVAESIRRSSVEIPGGGVKTRSGEVLLRTAERRNRGSEFEDIVLRSQPNGTELTLGDVAVVDDGFREVDQTSFYNGERAVLVNVYRVGDQTPLEVAAATRRYLAELDASLPAGVQTAVWNDASESYRDRIDLLKRNAIIGLILVLIILGMFLEPKLAFWVTLGIPISFAGSLIFLPGADVSINMISLFAFIVTLGMVVDDAIVVGEAIHQQRSDGRALLPAAIAGVREVARPVVFSIITTCVAFTPLLFVPGIMGKFFRVIPIVVISVLLLSLLESLLVLPAHLSHKMPWWLRLLLWPFLIIMSLMGHKKVAEGLKWFIARVYTPIVSFALRWRYVTLALGFATLFGTLGLAAGGRIQFSFMPRIESDLPAARLRMPVGTAIEETEALHQRLRDAAQATIDEFGGNSVVRGVFSEVGSRTSVGGGPRNGGSSTGSHLTSVIVYLVQSDQREFTTAEFVRRWEQHIGEIAGAENLSFRFSIGANTGSAIDIQLTHPDPQTLEAAAERLAAEIGAYSGVRDIDSGVSVGKEQLDFRLTAEGRARGLTSTVLARQVRGAFFGAEAVRQQRGRDEVRVYVRRPRSERESLHDVESFVVQTPQGGEMPLAQAATVERGRAYSQIKRVDGRRTISVTADIIEGQANANEVVASLVPRELTQLTSDIPGLTYAMGGTQKEQRESLGALGWGFVLALFVMFALLAVAFRSYTQPILVMVAIPFGIVGALWGHVIMGSGLSIMSMMGIVALSGVVVNDSLILIVAVNEFRERGLTVFEALVAGGARRFRPILLTSLTTFFGLVPMILEPSVQAKFLIPMAISLGFGVLFATFIMLLFVPACYHILEDIRGLVRRATAAFREEPPSAAPGPKSVPVGGE